MPNVSKALNNLLNKERPTAVSSLCIISATRQITRSRGI